MIKPLLVAVFALSLSVFSARAQVPVEVAGVKYERTVQLSGAKTQLNGAGVRSKAIFKVYTAGLYLPAKVTTTEAVLGAPGPKRVHIVMLREINAAELGKMFARGMEDNTPRDEFSKSIAGLRTMSEIFSTYKKLQPGDTFMVDWTPSVGTVITVNGKVANAPIREPEFYSAMLRIWLGQAPVDTLLKSSLLGS